MKPTTSQSSSGFSDFDSVIDVRSPAEYAEDHIPGAISAPVLDDDERAQVGTLYKQVSPFDAKKLGAALVAKNVARPRRDACSRTRPRTGGRWSTAGAAASAPARWRTCCARSAGTPTTLDGGYKAYRRWVVDRSSTILPEQLRLPRDPRPDRQRQEPRCSRRCARAGAQVLDLEALAAHRGSVLGDLPGPAAAVAEDVREPAAGTTLRRSTPRAGVRRRRIEEDRPAAGARRADGSACAPRPASCSTPSVETRVTLLLDEYRHFLADRAALDAQLDCLVALHGRERIAEWKALAARGAWREFVARLLVEHYDPAYRRSSHRNFVAPGRSAAAAHRLGRRCRVRRGRSEALLSKEARRRVNPLAAAALAAGELICEFNDGYRKSLLAKLTGDSPRTEMVLVYEALQAPTAPRCSPRAAPAAAPCRCAPPASSSTSSSRTAPACASPP